MKPRIIIVIEGGVCQGVFSDGELDLHLVDHDREIESDEEKQYVESLVSETEKLPFNYYP